MTNKGSSSNVTQIFCYINLFQILFFIAQLSIYCIKCFAITLLRASLASCFQLYHPDIFFLIIIS